MSTRIVHLCICATGLAAGCVDQQPATVSGLSSIKVVMDNPTADKLGGPGAPITTQDFVVDLHAIDANNQPFTQQDIDVDVFVSYSGNKIGQLTDCGNNEDSVPLATIRLTGGVAMNQTIHIEKAYGVSNIWVQEAEPDPNRMPPPMTTGSHAVGASPAIYFANPTIPQVQTPLNLMSPVATYCSPFNGKHVIIDHATGSGKIVVTSLFIDAYVIADTGSIYDPMTGTGGFNHLYVYAFGQPDAAITPGRVMNNASGNIAKFVGFSELNFPLQSYTDTVDPMLMPAVQVLDPAWRSNNGFLMPLSAATVSLTGTICPIDVTMPSWIKYNQFVLDMGNQDPKKIHSCDSFSTFSVEMSGKTIGSFDPLTLRGALKSDPNPQVVTVVGVLQNFSGQNEETVPPTDCRNDTDCMNVGGTCVEGSCKKGVYNFWNVIPRDQSDITVQP
jgi:hypothetical protein